MSPTSEPRATLHAIWQTRPSRRQGDRKIAGVAAAIARRYDIDPVLVRIAFVVAAFYGVGVLLYLAAWVTLPPDPADPPTGLLVRKGGAVHPVVMIAALVAGLAGVASLLSGDPGVLVGLAVLGGLLYLLHQSRSERGLAVSGYGTTSADAAEGVATGAGVVASAPASAATAGTGNVGSAGTALGTAGTALGTAGTAGTTGAAAGEPGRTPPAWDPLGAAPFAWDLPEPGPAPAAQPPARRRSVLTMATLGLALLAGGVTGALTLATQGLGGVRTIFGVMLAVVGLGLLVGAFRHTGRGLIALAIPLLLLGAASTAAPIRHWNGVGDLRAAPTTLADLAPSYRRTIGDVTVDLRRLDFTGRNMISIPAPATSRGGAPGASTAPPAAAPTSPAVPPAPTISGAPGTAPPLTQSTATEPAPATQPTPAAPEPAPVRTAVSLDAGDATVLLPPNVAVRLHCHADLGDVNCLGQRGATDGPSADVTLADPGVDVAPGTRPLELDVFVRAGDVAVRRG